MDLQEQLDPLVCRVYTELQTIRERLDQRGELDIRDPREPLPTREQRDAMVLLVLEEELAFKEPRELQRIRGQPVRTDQLDQLAFADKRVRQEWTGRRQIQEPPVPQVLEGQLVSKDPLATSDILDATVQRVLGGQLVSKVLPATSDPLDSTDLRG